MKVPLQNTARCMLLALLGLSLSAPTSSQQDRPPRFGITAKVEFNKISVPFGSLHGQFRSSGATVGVEYDYTSKGSLKQGLTLGYLSHPYEGRFIHLSLPVNFRQPIGKHLVAGISAGPSVALHRSSYQTFRETNGAWDVTPGKRFLFNVPAELTLGYKFRVSRMHIEPFLHYSARVMFGYADTESLLPITQTGAGLRIKL